MLPTSTNISNASPSKITTRIHQQTPHSTTTHTQSHKKPIYTIPPSTNELPLTVRQSRQTFLDNKAKIISSKPSNFKWGDSPTIKSGCRLLFHNINGISPDSDVEKPHIIAQALYDLQVDIFGMAEPNINWKDPSNVSLCTNIFRKYLTRLKFTTDSIPLTSKSGELDSTKYQPGGIAASISYPWSSQSKFFHDPSGLARWCKIELTGKFSKRIYIITAYAVGKRTLNRCGSKTIYFQQWHHLKQQHTKEIPDPYNLFHSDLSDRIRLIISSGHQVILMLDANDSLQVPESFFTKWVKKLQLHDILVERHNTTDESPSSNRGSTRIDYILCTPELLQYVKSCGMLPFHEICFSDHRAIFVDIDFESYLRKNPFFIAPTQSRGITGTDPSIIRQYQCKLIQLINEFQLIARLDRLAAKSGNWNDADKQEYQQIDKDFAYIRLKCEKECARKPSFPWSPALQQAYHQKLFWSTWKSELKINKELSIRRSKLADDTTYDYITQIPSNTSKTDFIHHKLSDAKIALRTARIQSKSLREQHLENRAKIWATDENAEAEKIVNAIIAIESVKKTFRNIRIALKENHHSQLEYVTQTLPDGTVQKIHEEKELELVIKNRNIRHYSQSDGTSFTKSPLKELVGPHGHSAFTIAVQNVTANIDSLSIDRASKAILRNLQIKNSITFDDSISGKDMQGVYQCWNENTTTSTIGLHLGHDKAILKFKTSQQLECSANDIPLYEKIFNIKAQICQLALENNQHPVRWDHIVNAMIEKKPGNPDLEKLCVIHLMENDFNAMIGIQWGRRMIRSGEQHNLFDNGQSGSRPDRSCHELLVQKHLTYGQWRLSQHPGASFDNDAKSCYDRIVMPLASMAAQQLGMPARSCTTFLQTLLDMKHHIKTAYGISEISYSSTDQYTIHGPGQGGRGSPGIWVAISSIAMKCMNEISTGALIFNPFKTTQSIYQKITGFVDDVTHWYAPSEPTASSNSTASTMQQFAQWWEELLCATGGKPELSKCFYYLILWEFDKEGSPTMSTKHTNSHRIQMIDSTTSNLYDIPNKPINESHKTLGVLETPSGNYQDEIKRLFKKSQSFAQKMALSNLTSHEAITAYHSVCIPCMIYSSAIGVLSKVTANKIQSGMAKQCLARFGFNRHIPNAIVYGPKSIGGIGFNHLFSAQGSTKTRYIIQMLQTNRPVQYNIISYISWAQLISGLSTSILISNHIHVPQFQNEQCLLTLREFLLKSQLGILICDLTIPPTQCYNDQHIMDIVYSMQLSDATVVRINRCRIFLKATTISDIADSSGTEITLAAYNCSPTAIINSKTTWPFQPHVGKLHITAWKKFISHICQHDSRKLITPLGHWSTSKINSTVSQSAFFDTQSNCLYLRIGDSLQTCSYEHKRRHSIITSFGPIANNIDTSTMIPATASTNGRQQTTVIWRNRSPPIITNNNNNNVISSWADYVQSIPQWDQSFIKNVVFSAEEDMLEFHIGNPTSQLNICSDGGFKDTVGSFAWVISIQSITVCTCSGTVHGSPISAHRSETFGKLSWLLFIHHYIKYKSIQGLCSIQSYCDCIKLIKSTTLAQTRYWVIPEIVTKCYQTKPNQTK